MGWGAIAVAFALLTAESGPDEIRGMRHPALSPDGRWIAFDWSGDIWICPSEGGTARRVTDDPSHEQKPAWSPDGAQLVFSGDRRGNLDLYVLDVATLGVERLTHHSSDEDAPAWSPDGKWIAFQSDRDSNLDLPLRNDVWDVWRMPAGGGTAVRVTRFRGQNPAWSPDGRRIAYDRYATGYNDGEHNIFVVAADGSGLPREVAAGGEDSRRPVFRGDALYFSHEANGIGRSGNRNVWRASPDGGVLRQVTGHDRDHVTWPTAVENHPFLVYEHDFHLYAMDLRRPGSAPRKLEITCSPAPADPEVTRVVSRDLGSPSWSPSGARVAFAAKGHLWTAAADGTDARRITASPDDDGDPCWTPDGESIVFVRRSWGGTGNVLLVTADGGKIRSITREPGHYSDPVLAPDGKSILVAAREGGESVILQVDVVTGIPKVVSKGDGAWHHSPCFSPDGKSAAVLATRGGRSTVVVIPLDGKDSRVVKTGRSSKDGLTWSPDGSRLAYAARVGRYEWNVRTVPLEGGGETQVAKLARDPSWAPDSSMIVCSTGRQSRGQDTLSIFDAGGGKGLSLEIRATLKTKTSEDMSGLFEQVWSSYYHNYYDPFYHGVDMKGLKARYAPLASACRTRREIYALINDMIAELRSSHIRLKPYRPPNTVATGSLAADLDRRKDGTLTVIRIEPGGPAAKAGIGEGETIVAVGDRELRPDTDFDALMTGREIPEVKLAIRNGAGDIRSVHVKGISRTTLRELKYANTIARRKEFTRERSGGRLAYFHITRMMSSEVARLRRAMEKEFPDAEGLVLDIRDGVGGMAHRPVCSLLDSTAADRLDRHPACWRRNRDGRSWPDIFGEDGGRHKGKSWDRPVIMIQNHISRSDKEILPHTFRHLGIGYLVGTRTAGGVIGGTDWTMQDGSRITVSTQGWFSATGRNMEGWGVPPDFRVPETHEDLRAGRDAQLEKSIDVLLAQMEGKIPAPEKPPLDDPPETKGR